MSADSKGPTPRATCAIQAQNTARGSSREPKPPLACQRRHEPDVATHLPTKQSSPVHDTMKAAAIGFVNVTGGRVR